VRVYMLRGVTRVRLKRFDVRIAEACSPIGKEDEIHAAQHPACRVVRNV